MINKYLVHNAKWALRYRKCRVINLWPLTLLGPPILAVKIPNYKLIFIQLSLRDHKHRYNAAQKWLRGWVRKLIARCKYDFYIARNLQQVLAIVSKLGVK